ncbi:amidase family protein [Streptomyces inhibens]|uniref:amidase family protein n=1 Tax=Streptomyces inhibens TaxID=2293571 RepID=UPI00402A9B04
MTTLLGHRPLVQEAAALRAAAGIDLWIAPSATGPAPADLTTTGTSIMCLPWSNAGLPAVSLPAGHAANGLPLGLQLIGGYGADEALLYGRPESRAY